MRRRVLLTTLQIGALYLSLRRSERCGEPGRPLQQARPTRGPYAAPHGCVNCLKTV